MPTVLVAPGSATLAPQIGGAVLRSVVNGATLQPSPVNMATLAPSVLNDAHITFTTPAAPGATAVVGSAVVGTSTVG